MTNETKFSITHFTKEEFEKYKEMHEDENTKIHCLEIIFWLDKRKEFSHLDTKYSGFLLQEAHETQFKLRTVAFEDVKTGKVKTIDGIIEKIEKQEEVIYEVYDYVGNAKIRGEDLELKGEGFIAKVVYDRVQMTCERNSKGEIEKNYFVKVFGELLNDDFEKEQPDDGLSQ